MEILELEKLIDRYLRDDIPLTVITDNHHLTKNQWALLISKLRGYEEMDRRRGFRGPIPSQFYEFDHEIPEEYPTSNEERIDLFIKLRKLEAERDQFQEEEYQSELKKYKTMLESIDKELLAKISGLVQELESGKTIEYSKLDEIFKKHGLSLHKISFYEALFDRYETATRKIQDLEQTKRRQNEVKLEIERIKRELIETNIKLPNWVIRTFFKGIELPIQDTQQVASQGLIDAINGFDPYRGTTFSTYAVPIIINIIKKRFKDLYGISWRDYVHIQKLADYRETSQEEDVHKAVGLSKKQVSILDGMAKDVSSFSDVFPEERSESPVARLSLESPLEGVDFIDFYSEEDLESIPDYSAEDPVRVVELADLRENLAKAMDRSLSEREKFVIEHYYNFSGTQERTYSYAEIGKMLGTMGKELSANRVREIALKALRKLMHPRNYRTYRDYAEPQRRLYSHSKAIDYNWIYRKLIHLLSMKLTDAGILTFMNMEGLKWSMSDLYEHIDRVNDMADQAAEEYEAGIDYYLIRDHINRRFDIRIDSYFVEYLLHEYMNIAKKEESKTK